LTFWESRASFLCGQKDIQCQKFAVTPPLAPVFSGTWVNEVRLQSGIQWELSDGDTLTFGGQTAPGSPEFYFLFQKVKVRPLDFDAITIPKVRTAAFQRESA